MKKHTIIFVPHARAKFRKWRLSSLQAGLILGTGVFLTFGGLLSAVSHFGSAFDRAQLEKIQQENLALREVNESFEKSLRDLSGQLGDYQQRIRKLAIVAGMPELSPASDAGIGGTDPNDASLDLAEGLSALEGQMQELGIDMGRLQSKFDEQQALISSTPAIAPTKGILTSGYGVRSDPFNGKPDFHSGIDIVAPPGKEVRASGDGIVTLAGKVNGLGNAVYVSHGYGIATRYGHLSGFNVKAGQKLRRGDVVGFVGNTGRATGYHLHYEVWVDGKATNPLGYILDDTSAR